MISLKTSRAVGMSCRTLIMAALTLSSKLLVPVFAIKLSELSSTKTNLIIKLQK